MNKIRGFEIVEKYKDADICLPERATNASAGYDFASAKTIIIPSIWKLAGQEKTEDTNNTLPSILVPTGIKAYMPSDEYLMLVNRSSNPLKHNLALPNGIGVIDADYYNNPNNEGEIFVQLINYGLEDYTIQKGERIAQGIFSSYYIIDGEEPIVAKRSGGFGSTGKN